MLNNSSINSTPKGVRACGAPTPWSPVSCNVRHCMTHLRCSMTGIEIQPGGGIWDDGEWISWESDGTIAGKLGS
jgi:hypothetical protein